MPWARTYLQGLGVPKNPNIALYYFRLSATRGDIRAQRVLGMLNEHKQGEHNLIYAYAWYALAAGRGDKIASDRLTQLRATLSSGELSEGSSLAVKFKSMIEQQ